MLYLAIPINLLLWGSETWALKDSDWKSLQVFHTKAIRNILRISMTEVEQQRITNTKMLCDFQIETIRDIAYSRQLRWLGKIARMGYNRMRRKMLCCWLNTPRPVGRPLTTVRHTYLDALRRIKVIQIDDVCGKINDWFPLAKNEKEWEKVRKNLLRRDRELGE